MNTAKQVGHWAGKKLSSAHKKAISVGLKAYHTTKGVGKKVANSVKKAWEEDREGDRLAAAREQAKKDARTAERNARRAVHQNKKEYKRALKESRNNIVRQLLNKPASHKVNYIDEIRAGNEAKKRRIKALTTL